MSALVQLNNHRKLNAKTHNDPIVVGNQQECRQSTKICKCNTLERGAQAVNN